MDIVIICVILGLVMAMLCGAALFEVIMVIVNFVIEKDRRWQVRHREYIKERRANKVYDNYLTRFESRG